MIIWVCLNLVLSFQAPAGRPVGAQYTQNEKDWRNTISLTGEKLAQVHNYTVEFRLGYCTYGLEE